MAKTKKFRKLKPQDSTLSESIAPEKPVPDDRVGEGMSPPSGSPSPEPIDLSSPMVEFSLRIGSVLLARRSMIVGYLTMVLTPAAIVLAVISMLGSQNTDGAKSLIRSLDYVLAVIAIMGLPIMIVLWADGLYPKGSYGRFASSSIFASLLAVWFIFLLFASDLQNALADFGMALKLERVFVLVCLIAVFFLGRAIFELIDERKLWRKSVGAKVEIAPLNLRSKFLDLDPHIGKLQKGNSSALSAYLRYLVGPTLGLVVIVWMLEKYNVGAGDAIGASVDTMFGTVLLFGIVMLPIHFVRGFYPSGSLGRMIFGLAGIPIVILFASKILLGSGLQEALAQSHLVFDMSAIMFLALIYILFISIQELAELVDNRRAWHKEIGMPVEPYAPEEIYGAFHDFRPRYASFVAGARKGRSALNKYIFRRIIIVMVLEAAVASAFQYMGGQTTSDALESVLGSRIGRYIEVLALVAVASATAVFFQCSYRKGSFARLAMSGVVFLFAALWAYVFWGSFADSIVISIIAGIVRLFMYVLIVIAGFKALWAAVVYSSNREEYLGWRLSMLEKEAVVGKPQLTLSAPAAISTSPGNLDG